MARNLKKSLLMIAITLLLVSSAHAMTWQEALTLSKDHNNDLKSAQKQLDSSKYTYYRSYTGLLPQLSANMSMSQTGLASIGASATTVYSYGLNATEYLFNGPTNFSSVHSAYNSYLLNQANFQVSEASIYYQIRLAFIDLYVAQENVKLQDQILSRQKENSRLISLQYDSGAEDKGNLLRTQANEKQSEYNLNSAKRDLRLAKLKLSQLLGYDAVTAEGAMSTSPEANPDFDNLISNSPDYLLAKYQLESFKIAQGSTVNEFLPSLSLSGAYRNSGYNWPPNTETNSWSLNLSYSFFPGGSNLVDSVINNINLDKAKEDFEKSKKDVLYTIEDAFEKYNDSIENLEVKKSILNAATERSKIGQEKYINGLATYTEWDISESDLISSQISALNAQKSALYAEATWNKSFGGYIK